MILVYHNIELISKDENTVNLLNFIKQMFVLLKYDVVHLDDYDETNTKHTVLCFDDGYKNIIRYALPILKIFNYPFEVFVVNDFINQAQNGNTRFMNIKDLQKCKKNNGRIQYHSKSHPDLSLIFNKNILEQEIICPDSLKQLDSFGFKYFAYPFWKFNDVVYNIVKENYVGALSGNSFANKTNWAMDRKKILNSTNIGVRDER